jgi:K+-sensing histidine kinase KdpD
VDAGRRPPAEAGWPASAEAEVSQRRTAFLLEAGDLLAASLDYETTLERVARLAVARVAEVCAVRIRDGQALHAVAMAYADPALEARLREVWCHDPVDVNSPHPAARACRAGESLHEPEVPAAAERRGAPDAARRGSALHVPLVARGRALGVLSLGYAGSGRPLGPADLALAEDFARRAALAVDNAQLYRAAQRAVGARDEVLAAASHELRTPLGHIKGFVSTLRQPDVEWDADTRAEFLAEIECEADRLARLVDDLLDLSRIESGGLDRSPRAPRPPSALTGAPGQSSLAWGMRQRSAEMSRTHNLH